MGGLEAAGKNRNERINSCTIYRFTKSKTEIIMPAHYFSLTQPGDPTCSGVQLAKIFVIFSFGKSNNSHTLFLWLCSTLLYCVLSAFSGRMGYA